VNYLHSQTKVHANKKNGLPTTLRKDIPLLGPRFVPPSYFHIQKRQTAASITPTCMHLKPINIIHPFYYPQLAKCPNCLRKDVLWEGWTSTGPRDVHGVTEEEVALGFQLRCKACEKAVDEEDSAVTYCFATTNPSFWTKWESWEIPREYIFQAEC
jgi:hypothetical protein